MLILTRRAGESLVIDQDIQVTVLRIKGGQIRLGISAPGSVAVRRAELPRREAARPGYTQVADPASTGPRR